ncbi:tenascin [Echeneis naucrates]|uniref:tenascin n=1 Tax=Echeneis naucrates TaxID=173247 RepID=UPI0011141283|nr:tenascin-like [Echeneis naucrates]
MLFTLGLLLLLTPFPSFQTPTNERRDSTGSNGTKANAVLTPSKPKTTSTLSRHTVRPTLKPNTVNRTVSPTLATNQKTPTVNAIVTHKGKGSPAVIQTTPAGAVNAAGASGTNAIKDKNNVSVNQTVSGKSLSISELKASKDKPSATEAPTTTQAPTKPVTTSGAKIAKDKLQPSVNQTVSLRNPSTTDGKIAKEKVAHTVIQNVQSTPTKSALASAAKTTKNKPAASLNQTVAVKTPSAGNLKNSKNKPANNAVQSPVATSAKADAAVTTSANRTVVVKTPTTTTKEKPAPSQPIKVLISDGCDQSKGKEQELKLKPGAPLVMTHKISLLPGGCKGECNVEMTALKERLTRLEKEMSLLKEKCPCSTSCPNNCNGNGECEKAKCVCHQGFTGSDCSKCTSGTECHKTAKDKAKEALEINQQKKEQKKETDIKQFDSKPRVPTNAKAAPVKTQQVKQEATVNKIITKVSSSTTKTSRPTVAQVLLKHEGRKHEEARKGKTTILSSKKVSQKTDLKIVKEGTVSKTFPKSDQLKDEPRTNVTQSNVKKSNSTAKIGIILSKGMGANKTRTGKETLEQATFAEKNVTQSPGHKRSKVVKVDIIPGQSVDNRNTDAGKTKVTQKSQYVVNAPITETSEEARVPQNKTTVHGSGMTKGIGGSGLGSVKVVNISSYSFTITWSAPQGMFKNFTLIRREPKAEGEEDEHEEFEEEAIEGDKTFTAKNPAEVQVQTESTDATVSSGKTVGSIAKTESKRISMVVPGSVRSMEFSNLRANTRYVLYIYGTGVERRSKIHRVTAVTGPEPATEMVFSNVTESSITVSWSKPKTTFTGFRVTYTNIATGESRLVVLDSQQSFVVLSKLSAGSSYIISVTATEGRTQSNALVSVITTVPAPPTHFQVVNVTDTRALLQWTPSLGKVDRFIISYESSKTPNVTVTVMVSGGSVDHQLRGLQRGTLYTVKILSQKDSLQSVAMPTTFTTANVIKANEVGARSAVITWKTSTVVYHSYRVIYQVAGEESKEVILDSAVTEYKLTGLLPMSRYTVLVQGERDGYYTSVVTTEFITGKLRFPFPTECSQELLNGALQSGEVDIYPQGKEGQVVRVYCDMETDGGGWTVFQRRMNGKMDFYRSWSEYTAGFGNLSEEFWLGNELLHNLTSVGPVSLRVDMRSGNDTAYAHYANFSVDSEERLYTLTVSGYTGTAGDSMRYHNGRPFSSRDRDPDPLGLHCARAYMGGWWYKNCYKTNLNGLYGINSNNQGIVWIDWKGKDSSIPFTEMKFRPSRFSPATHG